MNTDDHWLSLSILASLHPCVDDKLDHLDSSYCQFESELVLNKNLQFPVHIHQISLFERGNDISVNVFGLETGEIFPIRITRNRQSSHHVNLLLYKVTMCLLQILIDLSHKNKDKNQIFYCWYCLSHFTTQEILNEHME
jgi:hypothetical protein